MNEYFDPREENRSERQPMSKQTKSRIILWVCIFAGILVAGAIILVASLLIDGAATPEEAVADYQAAALTYDVDGMIEYSSYYNKVVLYGNRETSDRLLHSYLVKAYEGRAVEYTKSDIRFSLVSVLEYAEGDYKFTEMINKIEDKVEAGSENVTRVAIVRMEINNGVSDFTRDYLTVKIGFRWYFVCGLT